MFCFVDQILALDERGARGRFAIPEHFGGAPAWLIAEAVGQLAGWAVMAQSEFRSRPVAALVGGMVFATALPRRGVLELSVDIDRTDQRAVLYRGAVVGETGVCGELRRCLGPLLPMEELDDPAHARQHYERLRGAAPLPLWGAADSLPTLATGEPEVVEGGALRAPVRVPREAPFFADHFPRRAVLPATLLVQAMCDLASEAAAVCLATSAAHLVVDEVRDIKVRSFTLPGETLKIEARCEEEAETGRAIVRLTAQNGDQRVATARAFARRGDAATG